MSQAVTQAASQDVNKIILLGKASGPAQIAEDAGALFADFTISTATKLVGRGGQVGERIDIHDIEAADELVELVRPLAEGDRVYIEGELCTDEIEREGQPGQFDYFTRVCARNIIILSAASLVTAAETGCDAEPEAVVKVSKVVAPEPQAAPAPAPAPVAEAVAEPADAPAPAAPAAAAPVATAAATGLKPWQLRGAAAVAAGRA